MLNLFLFIFQFYHDNFFYLIYNVSSSPWMIHYIISIAFSQMEKVIEILRLKNISITNNIYTPTEISVGMVKEAKILLLSIGGDPELPLYEEMTHLEFRDGSCPFAAEVKIPPLYILLDKNLLKNIETTTKVVVQYLIKCLKIWGWWLRRMGYTPTTYNSTPGPYGGHIHFRLSSNDINALEDISRVLIKTLNTIGAVKALQWFEWERYEDNYYRNTCHIKMYGTYNEHENFDSSYKEGSRREYIHIEWRNPPFYVWYNKEELFCIILPVLINILEELIGTDLVGSIEYIRRRVKEIE